MENISIISAVLVGLGVAGGAQAAQINSGHLPVGSDFLATDRANFTVINSVGSTFAGANDVNMRWDGTIFTDISDYTGPGSASNMSISSVTVFGALPWTAHDVQVFAPGSYIFDVTTGGGNNETGTLGMNVGSNQLGMHMLWDWNGALNIDIAVILDPGGVFGAGEGRFSSSNCGNASGPVSNLAGCLWDGPGFSGGDVANRPVASASWGYVSVDGNGDTIPGIPMASGGPFAGTSFNFSANLVPVSTVPVPAAMWLFGSGLMGLLGVTGRYRRV